MPYDPAKDPFRGDYRTPRNFGTKSRAVTPNDSADLDVYCKILVTVGGTLQVLPTRNDDGDWRDLGTVAAGFIVPFDVRRVKVGSTATVITIEP